MLAAISIHCDKYACTGSLKPWVKNWFASIGPVESADDHGLLLLAAHMFRIPESFALVSVKIQQKLTPRDLLKWEDREPLNLLPHYRMTP